MKVKSDFVTNSSSTCYVVILPKDFNLDDNLSIKEHANDKDLAIALLDGLVNLSDYSNDKNKQNEIISSVTKEKLKEALIKKQHKWGLVQEEAYISQYDEPYLYYALISLFEQLDLISYKCHVGSDDGVIIFLFEDDIKKRLDKYKKLRRK
jgi:hypothetical protein